MTNEVGYKKPPKRDPERYKGMLSAGDRKVLYYLTDLADRQKTRTVQVYSMEIAKATGVSRRRVIDSFRRLKEKGYLAVEQVRTPYGNDANRYTILNPDTDRRLKIQQACDISGIPLNRMVEYVYWLSFRRDQLKKLDNPTVGDISYICHCPAYEAEDLVRGLFGSGILISTREVSF